MGSCVLLDVKSGTLGGHFAHALALECQPVRIVYEPIEDRVGDGRIGDCLVPVIDRQLAGHNRGSTIVTSQLPVDHWHEAIANPTIADAILDRLVHNAHRLTLKGESMRKMAAKRAGLDVKQDA